MTQPVHRPRNLRARAGPARVGVPAACAAACLAVGLCAPAAAQTAPAAAPTTSPAIAPVAAVAVLPASERRVVEDEHVRIEETRVRGQLQQVVVRPKLGDTGPYEIVVGRGGRDPTQDVSAAGRRVWSVLRF